MAKRHRRRDQYEFSDEQILFKREDQFTEHFNALMDELDKARPRRWKAEEHLDWCYRTTRSIESRGGHAPRGSRLRKLSERLMKKIDPDLRYAEREFNKVFR